MQERETDQLSQQDNVQLGPESELSDVEIIENPKQLEEPGIIDLTNLDGGIEHDSGEQDKPKKKISHLENKKKSENDSAFQNHEMGIYIMEKGILIGDSVATSQMTSNPTGLYNLQKISRSVMIGNEQNIKCTHKRLLDVICIQNDGRTASDTWGINLVPQLNHDLPSSMSAMKEGWQMNGRWKKQGIEIELLKKRHENFLF